MHTTSWGDGASGGARQAKKIYHESMRHSTRAGGPGPGPAIGDWEGYGAVRSETWPRPGNLTLDDGLLVLGSPVFSGEWVQPAPGMLTDFLSLADTPASATLRFARRWGLLELCNHDLPSEHPTDVGLPTCLGETYLRVLHYERDCVRMTDEPAATWRYWAGQASALANIGVRLRRGLTIDPRDAMRLLERAPWAPVMPRSVRGRWDDLAPTEPGAASSQYAPEHEHAREEHRRRVADRPLETAELRRTVRDALAFWLEMSRVTVRLIWPKGRPDVVLTGGLFGALGVQLLMLISGSQGFAFCAGCGNVHVPARPNDTQRASYCPSCRATRVPQRHAQRRYEAAKRRREAS
jgi:hypothetical protein